MAMTYEQFEAAIFKMTSIDLTAYKEKQMKRRIDTLINKHNISGYEDFVKEIKTDKKLYEEFVNYLTINVSEFYRNPEQWKFFDGRSIPETYRTIRKSPYDMECCVFNRR